MRKLVLSLFVSLLPFCIQAQGYLPLSCDSTTFHADDARSFAGICSEKKIVGLGEATHGTSEFVRAKSELVKALVQHADFRILAFETGIDAYLINNYLTGKSDDLASPMRGFYLIYHTREFIDLLRWLRDYNRTIPKSEQVIVYGFDSQHIGSLPDLVLDYLQEVDPVFLKEAQSRLDNLRTKLEPRKKHQYLDDLELIRTRVNDRKNIYLKHASEEKFDLMLKILDAMTSAVQQSTLGNNHGTKAQSMRDNEMLQNIQWIVNRASHNGKVIIWAHNGHIQKVNFDLKRKDHFRLGQGLYQVFDTLYYAIGLDFDKGSFNAVNYQNGATMQACQVANEKADSFAAIFAHVSFPCYFLDFGSMTPADRENLSKANCMREAGIGFSGEQYTFAKLNIKAAFDGIVFIKNTSATTFLDVRKVK